MKKAYSTIRRTTARVPVITNIHNSNISGANIKIGISGTATPTITGATSIYIGSLLS